MPRKDGTGPSGKGGMTGRGLGYCLAINDEVYNIRDGCRRGAGRGGRMRLATNSTDKELLLEQKKILKHQLATINKQLDKYSDED